MKEDPGIIAVREARHRISESVNHDPRKLVEYYQQLQERLRERLVSPPKKTQGEEDAVA